MTGGPVLAGRYAGPLIGLLLALKLAIFFVLAWNRRFVMDEFAQLGWAKYLGNGLFDTIWPSKAAGFTAFIKLAHLIGWDAQSILLAGRIQTTLLACATLGIVYACARTLGQTRLQAALVLLILLSFSNFMERIFETRAEPLAVFFGAAALLVVIRRDQSRSRILACGILSGLAFVATQKAIYFNVAIGLALVTDAALARYYAAGLERGCWLVLGWILAVAAYCAVFGGDDAFSVAYNLYAGPLDVASSQTAAVYGGLRQFVARTMLQNMLLYGFCFGGMILASTQIRAIDGRTRIAIVFTIIVTMLVFAHNQPWPYVFVMALPFMSLWALRPLEAVSGRAAQRLISYSVLAVAIAAGFARNLTVMQIDNRDQLALITRAERLTGPDEVYFDGIGMLPNRSEPSTVWLDRSKILQTLREGNGSEAYQSIRRMPPKVIIWSYRLDHIRSLIAPLTRSSYVRVAPNIWLAGRRLERGRPVEFEVPSEGTYSLYDYFGKPVAATYEVDGQLLDTPVHLSGTTKVLLPRGGPDMALLLPQGFYFGVLEIGPDNEELFADIYN